MATKATKKQKQFHPFFCHIKNCRKTAWDTPEYMSEEDWTFLEKVYHLIKNNDVYTFVWLQHDTDIWKNLFNHMLGWPEGITYCQDSKYVEIAYFKSKHNLLNIEKALFLHKGIKDAKYLITLFSNDTYEVEWDTDCGCFWIEKGEPYSPSLLKDIKLLTKMP